jgi:hypothetical protein
MKTCATCFVAGGLLLNSKFKNYGFKTHRLKEGLKPIICRLKPIKNDELKVQSIPE